MRGTHHITATWGITVAAMVGGLVACRTGKSDTKDVIPFTVGGVEPKVGDGYDSLVQEVRNVPSCVTGTATKLSSSSSTINLGQSIDSQLMLREFSGEVNGTPRVAFLQVGAAAGYFRSLSTKNSTATLVYGVKIQSGGDKLTDVTLNAANKALSSDALVQACGDAYVMQINRGGLLSITLSLDFGSEENRTKWQGKLTMTGALGDVAHDIGRKLERTSMDGTLTIKVNQVGGTPSQSLLSVKSCALSSPEEYSACKQRMDDLMAYASDAFPKQVDANPAILNYVTASLQTIGVPDLPTLPADVLQRRQQLVQLQQDSLLYTDMMAKARDAGLAFDSQLAADINANKDLIAQTATACFSYKATAKGADWSGCADQFKTLTQGLRKINADAVMVNELSVPADSESGNSIFNPYDSKMTIAYAVAKVRTWSFDATHTVGADGVGVGNGGNGGNGGKGAPNADALSPRDKQGALLQRTDQTYQRIDGTGQFDVYPGEAVGFVMNDILGKFGDNQGIQTVYWRCTNCGPTLKKLQTYRLRVKANAETGSTFRSHEDLTGTYRIVAYGQWRAAPGLPSSDAGGGGKRCNSNCPAPAAAKQTLVMTKANSGAVAIGREKTLGIVANAPVYFVMNDEAKAYGDNQGEMELILQCQRCDIKSHPIILDDDALN